MKIEIKNDKESIILTDEDLNNPNYVDVILLDDNNKQDPGFVGEITVNIEELKLAVDAFWQKKLNQSE